VGTSARRAARRRALDILFQADATGRTADLVVEGWRQAGRPVDGYTLELVRGVEADLPRIDGLLGEHAEGWTVPRMAAVDRTILRVACHELLAGMPAGVAINEAVEAAAELSTEASGGFINGVLGKIARVLAENAEGRQPET
jgi:transcription antitermination protein NusB